MPDSPSPPPRIKLNDVLPPVEREPSGSLYTRFRPYLQYLLNQEVGRDSQVEFYDAYVANAPVEAELHTYLQNITHVKGFFVGSTGIGKSTYIRKAFGATNAPTVMVTTSPNGSPITSLIIPFRLETASTTAVAVQSRVISKIRATEAFCLKHFSFNPSDDEMIAFIYQTGREDLLHQQPELDAPLTDKERLRHLKQSFEYAYLTTRLKMLAVKAAIDRVVVVVDNIETFSFSEQVLFVTECISFVTCFNNFGDDDRTIPTSLLIACRPATRLRMTEVDSINAHNFEVHEISAPVALDAIIKKRFDAAVKKFGQGRIAGGFATNLEDWRRAYNVLFYVIDQMTQRHGQLIVGLHNNNVRDAFAGVAKILANSDWFEAAADEAPGAFRVEESSFHATEARILRALVLGSGRVYRPIDRTLPIANLFHNGSRSYTDFICPLVCKYFLKQGRNTKPVVVPRSILEGKLARVLEGHKGSPFTTEAIAYLIDREVLRVEDGRLIGLPRLYSSWKMMYRSSVLLEFFRDDTFIPEVDIIAHCRASSKGVPCATADLRYDALFRSAAELVMQVASAELEFLEHVVRKGVSRQYFEDFGSFIYSRRALRGLSNSISVFYYRSKPPTEVIQGRANAELAVRNIAELSQRHSKE